MHVAQKIQIKHRWTDLIKVEMGCNNIILVFQNLLA